MKTLVFVYCCGLFAVALSLGIVAAFFHALAWPFYVAAIAVAKVINHANRNSKSQPHLSPAPVRDVPPRV